MRFEYSFQNWIWKNLRRSIRLLPQTSLWYIFLESLFSYFESLIDLANWLYDQIDLNTSSGIGLNLWGKRYGLQRLVDESDLDFKNRILYNLLIYRNNLTRKRRREILSEIFGIPVDDIFIYNFTNTFTSKIGDRLAYSIYSRKAELYTYQVIFPRELTTLERERVIEFMSRTNLGGNLPIFKETLLPRDLFAMGENYNNWIQSRYSEEGLYNVF